MQALLPPVERGITSLLFAEKDWALAMGGHVFVTV
jgi:hypothetical protein